jgi:hypothetical protein
MSKSSPGVSGKKVIIWFLILTALLGVATWYLPAMAVVKQFEKRPAELDAKFAEVEAALHKYRAEHGEFPPETNLGYYWNSKKNRLKTGAVYTSTYELERMTSPVAYLDPKAWGDPFALPEQYSPLAYVNLGDRAVLWSPAENLDYDIRGHELRGLDDAALEDVLIRGTYDPTNGVRSTGDRAVIVRAKKD